MTRYAMVIDLGRCIGCWTCVIACKQENNEPMGVFWNKILTVGGDHMDTPAGKYPYLKMHYMPLACQHCENPPCVKVCPVGATYKREDGLVLVDYDRCIGCRYCMAACPYEVRNFNWGAQTQVPEFPVGHQEEHRDPHEPDRVVYEPVRPRGVVEKCSFCVQRIDKGLLPACIEVCPARARHFGDLDDPASEVSKLVRKGHAEQLLSELGTDPKVFFIPPYNLRMIDTSKPYEEHLKIGGDKA